MSVCTSAHEALHLFCYYLLCTNTNYYQFFLPPRLSKLTGLSDYPPAPICSCSLSSSPSAQRPSALPLAIHAHIHTVRPTHEPPASPRSPKGGGGARASPARPHSRAPGPWGCTPRPACLAATRKRGRAPAPPIVRTHVALFRTASMETAGDAHREVRALLPPPPQSRIARDAPEVRPTYVRPGAAGPLGWRKSF